jgi:hypothetical protein
LHETLPGTRYLIPGTVPYMLRSVLALGLPVPVPVPVQGTVPSVDKMNVRRDTWRARYLIPGTVPYMLRTVLALGLPVPVPVPVQGTQFR